MYTSFKFKTTAAAAALALGALVAPAVHAATLSGTYTIDVYVYNAGGNPNAASATSDNVDNNVKTGTITYTGDLAFYTDVGEGPTINEFLMSGGGTIDYSACLGCAGLTMSGSGFQTTTLLDISGEFSTGVTGTIDHDDGVSLYDVNGLVLDNSYPTASVTDSFSADAGSFRLIYSAANGNPEELRVDVAPVPLPAAGLLLVGALGGLGALRRRKAKAA